MMPAMVGTPEEPGSQGTNEANLDPEDAPVDLDEDGFFVTSVRRRQFPTDLDVWVRWAGAVVVGVAAFETLAYLISGSLSGWATGIGNVPLPRPDGYYSLLLLAGVLLLVLGRGSSSGAVRAGWARGAACLAAGTGGALVVAQVAGNIGAIVRPSGEAYGQPAAYIAGACHQWHRRLRRRRHRGFRGDAGGPPVQVVTDRDARCHRGRTGERA
jgi:hypothetical protein